ncbi:MAG: 50S ribosomal protein L23 [Gammaproteobacteria bacterium]|nr:50S ribosomal protein L23 [Gammaproteobacteria bacterium]
MKAERLYGILREPHVTEKVTGIADSSNQYAFKVDVSATKKEIREAVETIYDVKVENVTTLRVKGQGISRFARVISSGRQKDWKKAYVKLRPDDRIDYTREIK